MFQCLNNFGVVSERLLKRVSDFSLVIQYRRSVPRVGSGSRFLKVPVTFRAGKTILCARCLH